MSIFFYGTDGPYGYLSNFAPYKITLKGKIWPTTEHYFQSQKFSGTEYEETIRQSKSPAMAARLGRSRSVPLRTDWEEIKESIMLESLYAKFTQHVNLRQKLLETGETTLVEHTTRDTYWGDGGDGRGKNRLGVLLMRVRRELQMET
jgi:ribA/ribD-fused uncharacterized protein